MDFSACKVRLSQGRYKHWWQLFIDGDKSTNEEIAHETRSGTLLHAGPFAASHSIMETS